MSSDNRYKPKSKVREDICVFFEYFPQHDRFRENIDMNDNDTPWAEAIYKVLSESATPMHYTEIAEAIAEQDLRKNLGATPAQTVNSYITTQMKNPDSIFGFSRISRGVYWIKRSEGSENQEELKDENPSDASGLINAFGMYWSRSNVLWASKIKLLGQQQPNSTPVDFANQIGVYLLHDGRSVVYVGRSTDQTIGVRLKAHTSDRLNGRWDRFSWFGIYPVDACGTLTTDVNNNCDLTTLIITMEALLIEGLEPPQNRKRGDEFRAIEYLQVEDPEIARKEMINILEKLKNQL